MSFRIVMFRLVVISLHCIVWKETFLSVKVKEGEKVCLGTIEITLLYTRQVLRMF